MGFIIRLIIRLCVLVISFALSVLVAAAFLTFALFLGGDTSWLQNDPLVAGGALVFAAFAWMQMTTLALGPAAIIALGLEMGRISSLIANLIAGGACAAIVLLMTPPDILFDSELPYDQNEVWMAVLASGFVAGLIHWVVAGHRAGRWMGTVDANSLNETQ